jgi:hypothetical protein
MISIHLSNGFQHSHKFHQPITTLVFLTQMPFGITIAVLPKNLAQQPVTTMVDSTNVVVETESGELSSNQR